MVNNTRAFAWAMAVVLMIAVGLRLPRMGHSMWNDELWSMEMFVIGETVQKDPKYDFSNTWQRAIYSNPVANNHLLCTIETRIAHSLWKNWGSSGSTGQSFSEPVLRFPSFLWSLVGIVLAGLLGRQIGGLRLGGVMASLFALHPWAVRFATETRGYSAGLALVLLMMVCLHRLFVGRSQHWGWWLGFALAECLGLLSCMASLPVVASINAVALGVGFYRKDWQIVSRLVAANTLAATLFLDVAAPGILQVSAFLKERATGSLSPISLGWWQDIASAFTCGEDWVRGYHGMRRLPTWQVVSLLTGCYGLTLLGLVQIWRQGSQVQKIASAAWLLALSLTLVQNIFAKFAMLSWYLCPLLPGMFLCMASAFTTANRRITALASGLAVLWLLALSLLLGAQVFYTKQPIRDASEWVNAHYPQAFVGYLGITEYHVDPYLPTVHVADRRAHSDEDILNLVKGWQVAAGKAHQPLVVCFGGHQESRFPMLTAYFAEQGIHNVAKFGGADEIFDLQVMTK